MLRIFSILSLLLLTPQFLVAQVMPRESSVLNYRLIGFSFPSEHNAINYTIEISAGHHESETSFRKNIISKLQSKTNKIIAEVPSFGNNYTWRIIYTFRKSSKTTTALFHFSTGMIPEVDTNFNRLKITTAALKYKDAYVFLDGNKVLYDMNGRPVWYMPDIEGISISANDLKLSPQGTLTFISVSSGDAYEINYSGDILWKAPINGKTNGKNKGFYHHQFTRLSDGNYMVLGNEYFYCPMLPDGSFRIDSEQKDSTHIKSFFDVLMEYDGSGNIIWSWKSSEYFQKSDLIYYKQPRHIPIVDLHENAFFFDEIHKIIYINYKNISRVVKIKYPEGTIINSYGETFKPGVPEIGNGLFCDQHCVSHTDDGCIILFNNNKCNVGQPPKIEKLKEPLSGLDTLKKIWEYECSNDFNLGNGFPSGGNVTELPDHSIFVSTAAPDSKVFIVNMDKEILWSALPERWNTSDKTWEPLTEYRASIIENKKSLERMIWNGEISEQSVIAAKDLNMSVPRSEPIVKRVSQAQ